MLAVSRFVLRHKPAVAIFWLVVLAAGGIASANLSGRLSAQFALPGAAGYQASQQILRIYGNGGPGYPEVAVVTLPPGLPSASPARGGTETGARAQFPEYRPTRRRGNSNLQPGRPGRAWRRGLRVSAGRRRRKRFAGRRALREWRGRFRGASEQTHTCGAFPEPVRPDRERHNSFERWRCGR